MKEPSWADFKKFVREYEPYSFEFFEDRGFHHIQKSVRRFYRMLCVLNDCLKPETRLCDLGSFPGTFIRILLHYDKDLKLQLTSTGLLVTPEFRETMRKLGVEVLKVNLDPAHDGLPVGTGKPEYNLSDRKGYFDIVVASELIEHMVNPLHLVTVARDILKPGGHLLLTTPNLAWIKNRISLLRGGSPNEPLSEGLFSAEESGRWRPHYRVYTMGETRQLLEREGLMMVHGEFLQEPPPAPSPLKKLLYSAPSFRRTFLILAQKKD